VIEQFKREILLGIGGDQLHPTSALGSYHVATMEDFEAGAEGHREVQNAFGAVLANLSASSPATAIIGQIPGETYEVPVTTGPGTFSFAGILGGPLFDIGKIELRGTPIDNTTSLDGLIAIDDIILGHSGDVPEPSTFALIGLGLLANARSRSRPPEGTTLF
jgi:hypothetical protein